MSIYCCMVLRDDSLRSIKTRPEKINRLRQLEDRLINKYGFARREEAVTWETFDPESLLSFEFNHYGYGGVSFTICDGFWEIETCWGYGSYLRKEGGPSKRMRDSFFQIAQDLGCDEGYICSEYATWNSDYLEKCSFDEWIQQVKDSFGVYEVTAELSFNDLGENHLPVLHDSFDSCKKELEELSKRVDRLGFSMNGLYTFGRNFIMVSKGNKVYVMGKETLFLLVEGPISYLCDLGSAFEIVSNGTVMLFAYDGQLLFQTDKGHFEWDWANPEEWNNLHTERVYNELSGQEVFVKLNAYGFCSPYTPPDHYEYCDANHNQLIPNVVIGE